VRPSSLHPFPRHLAACAALVVSALLLGACAAEVEDTRSSTTTADNRPAVVRQDAAGMATSPGASAYGDFLAGVFASQQRDISAAADYMARALASDPDNPDLLRQTFLLMASEGRMREATALAERLARAEEEDASAILLLSLNALRDGDLDTARSRLSGLPDRGLSSITKPLVGAWLETAQGNPEQALSLLAELDSVNGVEVLREVHGALIHDLSGDVPAAREAFGAAIETAGQMSLRMAWLAGNFHARRDGRDAAVAFYERYLTDNPESVPVREILKRTRATASPPEPVVATPIQGAAEGLFNLAGLLNQQGAGELALVYTRLALHLRPGFDAARVLLGEIMQGQSRGADAIAVYRKVPKDSPFHYLARLRLAAELDNLGRGDKAIDLLEAVAANYPERYEPLYRIGNIHRAEESFERAAEAYGRALERIEAPGQHHWSLYYFRGIALERIKRWQEAEVHFKKALELQPEQPYVMNYLAYSWVEQETNLEKAQTMLRRAVEQRPEDGYIVDSLGWVHYRLGHYDKAVKHLERAVELRPHDPVINDHLGDAYWQVGRRQEARFQWQRALSLDPDPETVASIEAKLAGGLEAAPQPNG